MAAVNVERDDRVLELARAGHGVDTIAARLDLRRRQVERSVGRLRRQGELPHDWRPNRE
ncbi:MAG TPA: hypothetical protein VFS67_35575 [Polyangiaceae bacterium]|nr:hypothetical protein [Polyangiaceae bacterium]